MNRRVLLLLLLAAPASAETLTLQQAVQTGLSMHPALQQAGAQRDAARARVGEAFSNYLPQLGFNAFGRADYSSAQVSNLGAIGGGASGFAGSARYSAQLNLTQNIYDFGRTGWNVTAARRSADAARADVETTRATVELNVVNAYYQVLQSIALARVADDALAQAEQHLAQAEALFKIGTRPEMDVASAESDVAQAKLQVVRARNAITVAKATLNGAMGLPRDTAYDVVAQPVTPIAGEQAPMEDLVNEALKARPEYESLRQQAAATDAQVHAARANYYPILGAQGLVNANGTDTAAGPFYDFAAQLNLTVPIFNGFLTRRTVEENEAQARGAQAQLDALALGIRSDLTNAVLTVRASVEAVEAADAAQRAAEKQLAMAEGRYRNGVGTIIELVDAQTKANAARAQRVQAEYTLAAGRAALARSLGRPVVAREVKP